MYLQLQFVFLVFTKEKLFSTLELTRKRDAVHLCTVSVIF